MYKNHYRRIFGALCGLVFLASGCSPPTDHINVVNEHNMIEPSITPTATGSPSITTQSPTTVPPPTTTPPPAIVPPPTTAPPPAIVPPPTTAPPPTTVPALTSVLTVNTIGIEPGYGGVYNDGVALAGSYDIVVVRGSSITLYIDYIYPNPKGIKFIGWSGDVNSAEASITITVDTDKVIFATFQQYLYVGTAGEGYPWLDLTLSERIEKYQAFIAELEFNFAAQTAWGDSSMMFEANQLVQRKHELVVLVAVPAPTTEPITLTITTVGMLLNVGGIIKDGVPLPFDYTTEIVEGEVITLSIEYAYPNPRGVKFIGWIGDQDSTNASITFTVNTSTTVTAVFQQYVYVGNAREGYPWLDLTLSERIEKYQAFIAELEFNFAAQAAWGDSSMMMEAGLLAQRRHELEVLVAERDMPN
ncbi:MAG: InlB B-repeat-containing protein [Dehalogenimonas sp.]